MKNPAYEQIQARKVKARLRMLQHAQRVSGNVSQTCRFFGVSRALFYIWKERKERRQPHILTFAEEKKLLASAPELIRVLAILILDTGLRSGRKALALKWEDIDFSDEAIWIRKSKTLAGIRNVPMSSRCKTELQKWRTKRGIEFSGYVLANPEQPETNLRDVRRAWPDALKAAGLEYFWLYDLRHTFASRLTAAGVSPIFVAQIMGHSNSSILQTYAKAIDEFRRSAISKLETFREAQSVESAERSEKDVTTRIQ